ncbi:MAG: GNAT family N-acetyltransferase [Gammaproteobacteria bacterium]|nr:GNAT family N-acetyltransferase [Gammaproteobacteria bacterium]
MELEQRTEAIEHEVLTSLYTNCPAATKKALGFRLVNIDDALLLTARADPNIMLNRVHGLCGNKEIKPSTIQKIAATYTALGIKNYFLHLYIEDQPQASKQQLINAGLIETRGWMRFIRDNSVPPASSTELRIEKIGSDHANEFARIVCQAFDISEAAIPMIAALANDPRWHLFASFDGDTMAGAGAMFVQDDIAWLDWGATAPKYRCKGSQAAIMATRIEHAKSSGCKHIVTETGEAVEGDPQHSYKNIIKHGFAEMRMRQNYKPQPQ